MVQPAAAQEPTPSSLAARVPEPDNWVVIPIPNNENPRPLDNSGTLSALPKLQERSVHDESSDDRCDLATAYAFVRFRSVPIHAKMSGLNQSFACYATRHLALEASLTAAFGQEIFDREHSKYLYAGVGPRLSKRTGRLRPFVHASAGIIHMLPQTALGNQYSLGVQAGGGIDYARWPGLSLRVGADWVHSHLYGRGQDNIQFVCGWVIHF
jgi:hypothetical protein